jgi:predicted O-linked N-acetylglucosamine transferase (SPINDLY family)
MNLVVALFSGGMKEELETLTRSLVERCPQSSWAWKSWGAALQALGMESLSALEKAVLLRPDDHEAIHLLGIALEAVGRTQDAKVQFKRALRLNPNFAEALVGLANNLMEEGKYLEAEECLRRSLKLQPDMAATHLNLGVLLSKIDQLDEAKKSLQRAVEINPRYADAHYNLGLLHRKLAQFDSAEQCYLQVISVDSLYVEAYCELANLLVIRKHYEDARAIFARGIHIKPSFALLHIGVAWSFIEQDRFAEAEPSLRRAIEIDPLCALAYANLGIVLRGLARLDEGQASTRQALQIDPKMVSALCNLGVMLKDAGRAEEAERAFRQALVVQPDYAEAYHNLLSTINFRQDADEMEVLHLAQEYDRRFCSQYKSAWPKHANSREAGRRLRIGYVSADFRHHAVAYFFEPILANHNPDAFEIFCFAQVQQEDEYTARFKQYAHHWHSLIGLDDDAAARLIQEQQIDILVDLTGHTSGNRLQVFARKPAPVQMTYLGYPGSTGMEAVDYKILDVYSAPEGVAEAAYTERILRLPHSLWCYRPTADMPEPTELPALHRGYITFGSFNNFNKIDSPTLDLWAEILLKVPNSRLLMVTVPEGETRSWLAQQFVDRGVAVERLEFRGKLNHTEFHRMFLEVDVSLDPLNVNGATTTCESLWMGVPVISLVGSRFSTRAGYSILMTAGFSDFVAYSHADYLNIARSLANNYSKLADLRRGLRARLRMSLLTSELEFTSNFEKLLRRSWMQLSEAASNVISLNESQSEIS